MLTEGYSPTKPLHKFSKKSAVHAICSLSLFDPFKTIGTVSFNKTGSCFVHSFFPSTQLCRYCILSFIQSYHIFWQSVSAIIRQQYWFKENSKKGDRSLLISSGLNTKHAIALMVQTQRRTWYTHLKILNSCCNLATLDYVTDFYIWQYIQKIIVLYSRKQVIQKSKTTYDTRLQERTQLNTTVMNDEDC